jgi:hypothetical protein
MTVTYEIPAKPTLYKGQTFRSRLEAKWAAFFDILEWEWVYEPFDLGGWSPDFAIRAPGADSVRKVVLVEVKPIMEFDEDVARKMEQSCPSHLEDVDGYDENDAGGAVVEWLRRGGLETRLVLDFELLLLGVSPIFGKYEDVLGWLRDDSAIQQWGGELWDEALFQQVYDRVGFYHNSGSYNNRISNFHYKGDVYDRERASKCQRIDVEDVWGRASSAVQWQPTRRSA